MAGGGVIVRFDKVSFAYDPFKPILNEVSFSLRTGSKFTLMGQNGAGKRSLFGLLTGALVPESGAIHIDRNTSIATAR